MRRTTMRLLVVGDEKVGKTSLIYAMMSQMPNEIVRTLKKVVLPPDMCAYSRDIFTEVVDTSVETDYSMQIQSCDLVLLVYDVTSETSITRLQTHWMPIINSITREKPVIIVGNKIDLIENEIIQSHEYVSVKEVLRQLARGYRQIQMGVDCSAYYDKNVCKVLSSAHRTILFPLAPLYDMATKQITPKFRKALIRIFRVLDREMCGSLSDNDLQSLQERVFKTQLSLQDLKIIKSSMESSEYEGFEQRNNSGIQVSGFIAFHKKCIEMLKIQICWSILRYFNYEDDLQIQILEERPMINENAGESLQFTPAALGFLNRMYGFAVKIARGVDPMEKLFESSPRIPIDEFHKPGLTLQEYQLAWEMFAFLDYRECHRNMLYIGYDQSLAETFRCRRGKVSFSDLQNLKSRKVFSILLVDHEYYTIYTERLFRDAVEDGVILRTASIFSQKTQSRILLLFKIRPRHLQNFLDKHPLSKRIDLLVHFDSAQVTQLRNLSEHLMVRTINREQAEKEIRMFELSELNLKTFPVEYKKEHFDKLFNYFTETFEKIQLGFSKQKIERLKSRRDKFQLFFIFLTGFLITATGVFYAKQKFRIKM